MSDFTQALISLRPGAVWTIRGDTYEGLEWLDENQTKPTEQEIQAERERLENLFIYNEYQRKRSVEYPSFADQLDLLYHGGYDAWRDAITAIKNKYPKPSEQT